MQVAVIASSCCVGPGRWWWCMVVVVECCCCIPYTSSCELHSLKVATGEKEPHDAQTRGLRSNAEFQPREPPMWPRFFVSNRRIYGHGRQVSRSQSVRWCAQRTATMCLCMSPRARDGWWCTVPVSLCDAVSVMQAGVTCTSSCELHSLKVATGKKRTTYIQRLETKKLHVRAKATSSGARWWFFFSGCHFQAV